MEKRKNNPSLFGLDKSNKDFSLEASWGKNQFNSSFPASLACYMDHVKINPIYLKLNRKLEVEHDNITVKGIFNISPKSPDIYFAFEESYTSYSPFITGRLPRIDLVIMNSSTKKCQRGIEIKVTALPDHQTCDLEENRYGSEIVVRPDSIVYLALSIAIAYQDNKSKLYSILKAACNDKMDWEDIKTIKSSLSGLIGVLDAVLLNKIENQTPFMLQPIWKTKGKTLRLTDNCFDIFMWSDFAFTRLFVDCAKEHKKSNNITRHARTVVWLVKMLYDFSIKGKINNQYVIDNLTYNTKNDKAFACGGTTTHPYMECPELTKPRVKKVALRNIILDGGEKYLSPERRLDAAILSTTDIF